MLQIDPNSGLIAEMCKARKAGKARNHDKNIHGGAGHHTSRRKRGMVVVCAGSKYALVDST